MENPKPIRPILRVWTHRDYALFMVGCIPNYITFWMQRVGIGWLAWDLTHSTFWLGLVTAIDLAPLLLLAPIAGALVDRWGALRQFRVTQIGVMLHAAAFPVLYFTGLMNIEALVALTIFSGIVYPFMSTARLGVLPRILPRDILASGIGLDSAFFHGSRFVGPAIAALLIPLYGVGATFVVNVIGSAGLMITLWMISLRPAEGEPRKAKTLFADVGEAFSYVRHHKGIGPIFLLLTIASTFTRPIQDMLPGIAGSVFHSGPEGLAWLTSALGIGGMISAAWIATRGRVSGLTTVIMTGAFNVSIGSIALVMSDQLMFGIPFAVLIGFSLNTMSTSVQTLVQSAVSDDMRGRVMSLYVMIFRGAPALGSLVIGLISDRLGLTTTFLLAGCLGLLSWGLSMPKRQQIAASLETPHNIGGRS